MDPGYLKKLRERKEKGSDRSLLSFDGFSDFWSNDYLGMARLHTSESFEGSTGSRLISGNSTRIENAEHQLAQFFGAESALVFNSGYDANLGFFSAVPQKGDTVFYDELIHASVRDGIRLSHAKAYSFRHNDLTDLKTKWKHAAGTVYVAVESLYSMDGDVAPLKALTAFCEANKGLLVVDEAHSGGIFGNGGRGLVQELGLEDQCFARLFTFGKAYGMHGAVICGNETLREFLINFARSFIYTTALPEMHYKQLAARVFVVEDKEKERNDLRKNIALFRQLIPETMHFSDALSPIQIVPVPELKRCIELAELLQTKRFAVKAILPPTVPENGQRLRICLHAFNTPEEISQLATILSEKVAH